MKRSPRTVKAALAVATIASGLAASVPAFGGAYVTIDLVARPAVLDANRYSNASDGAGGTSPLPGYKAAAPNSTVPFNTSGFTSIITPVSAGELYELGIRVTLAAEGTTNIFATGGTSIANWNPSNAASNKTGLFALAFNLVAASAGIQPDFKKTNQGVGYDPDPALDGSQVATSSTQVILSRQTASSALLTGSPYGGSGFDAGVGYSGGTLVDRGTGFSDASHVVLINGGGVPALIGGTTPTIGVPTTNAVANYLALGYFSIGDIGSGVTNAITANFTGFAATELLAGLRWRNSTDTVDVNFAPTLAMQTASVAGLDPIIKINNLVLQGSTAAGATPAAILVNPATGSTRIHNDKVTVTNTAVGGTVDPAVISNVQVVNALGGANATWSQTGFTNGQLVQGNGGASAISTVTVTELPNILAGAKGNGTFSFDVAGQTTTASAGQGSYSYNLQYTRATNSAPVSGNTTFATAQTAAVATGDKVAGLSTTENGGSGRTLTLQDSTVLAGQANVAVSWRSRSNLEAYPGSVPPLPPGISALITDVANVSITGSVPTTYVVMLNYLESGLGGIDEVTSFNANHLFLAQMLLGGDGQNGSADDSWRNATIASGTPQLGVLRAYQASDLNTPGLWGVDTVNNQAWAVLPGSVQGQFAVVPEPASLGLLALGALGLISRRRR